MLRAVFSTVFALAVLAGATFAQEPRLRAKAQIVPATAAPGDEVALEVTLEIDPGWHVYGAREETGSPVRLTLVGDGPLTPVGTAMIPDGDAHTAFGIESFEIHGTARLSQQLKVPADAKPGKIEVKARVDYMACDEQMCDPPNAVDVAATLEVKGGAPAAAPPAPAPAEGHVAAAAQFTPKRAAPGDEVVVEIAIDVESGWHVYGSKETGSIPTTVEVEDAGGLEAVGDAEVPPGERHEAFGIESFELKGRQVLRQHMKVPSDAKPGSVTVKGRIDFMACTDQACDPPTNVAWSAALEVEQAGAAKQPSAEPGISLPLPGASAAPDAEFGEPTVTPPTAHPGELVTVSVPVAFPDGWHTYGKRDENPMRLSASDAGSLVAEGANALPDGAEHKVTEDLVNYWVAGQFAITQAFRVPKDAKPGDVSLKLAIDYQICDENSCLPPAQQQLTARVTIAKGPVRAEFAGAPSNAAVGGGSGGNSGGDTSGDTASGDGLARFGGLWGLILASIAGGLFALAMPCTYPMIPITISFFTKQADHREGKVLSLALAYGAGIVLVFAAIGVVVGFSAQAGDSIIDFSRNWIVNLVVGLVFLVFALSLFGLFILQPPRFLMDVAGKASTKGGYLGVFLMGTTLVVTSFTCTAPVVGIVLGLGAKAGLFPVVLGMAVFGLTMAVPFVVLSLLPGKARSMPRAGEWMNTLKVFLGFVEVAAAMKFLSNADVVMQWGALPRELFLLIWTAIFAMAGLFLLGMFKLKDAETAIGPGRMTGALATLMFAAYCAFGALGFRMDQVMTAIVPPYSAPLVEGIASQRGSGEANTTGHTIVRDDYSAALAMARKQDKLLLVNFTGLA